MGNCQNLPGGLSQKSNLKSKTPSGLHVSTLTWTRDSHGLFDYESKTLSQKDFKAQSTGIIRRNANEVGFAKDNEKHAKQGDKDLLKLSIKDGNFWINSCSEDVTKRNKEQNLTASSGTLEQEPWLVLKSYKTNTNKGYKLSEGDLIKLGRVKYRIREIKGTPTISSNKPSSSEKHGVNTEIDNNASLDESFKKSPKSLSQININQTCRICLSETAEPDDPFFSPCNCTGTMASIHVKCLQRWLKSKLHYKTTPNTTYICWKSLECELCKTPYPQFFEVENKRFDIVEIERSNCAYIVLEAISKEKNITRGVHIIKMEGKNNIRMGRGHDSDIRITDISVSRCHAVIKLDKGNFFIEDNNSKFGTLVHLSKPTPIAGELSNISVQIGRTVITFTSKKGKGFFPICFGQKTNVATERHQEPANDLFDLHDNELNSPNSPLSPAQSQNQLPASNVRERNYRLDAPLNQNARSIVEIGSNERQNRLNNIVLPPNLGDHQNEGNIGEEADERSYYSQ